VHALSNICTNNDQQKHFGLIVLHYENKNLEQINQSSKQTTRALVVPVARRRLFTIATEVRERCA